MNLFQSVFVPQIDKRYDHVHRKCIRLFHYRSLHFLARQELRVVLCLSSRGGSGTRLSHTRGFQFFRNRASTYLGEGPHPLVPLEILSWIVFYYLLQDLCCLQLRNKNPLHEVSMEKNVVLCHIPLPINYFSVTGFIGLPFRLGRPMWPSNCLHSYCINFRSCCHCCCLLA